MNALAMKYQVVGFFRKEDGRILLQELQGMGFEKEEITMAAANKAAEIVNPSGRGEGFFMVAKRLIQRTIGGGPAEFLRDVQKMHSENKMFISVKIADEEDKNRVIEAMKNHHGQKLKYFHPLYVEHITFDNDRAEFTYVKAK